MMYNGWINYQTWLYALHRGEEAYSQLLFWVSEDYEKVFADLSTEEGIEKAVTLYAAPLKEYAAEEFYCVLQSIRDSYISDALSSALEDVDFRDIVKGMAYDVIYQVRKEKE